MTTDNFEIEPSQWEAEVATYALLREPLTLPFGLDTLAALKIKTGERLLDVACGTGGVALTAARQGVEVIAVDSSPGMVNFLNSRAKNESLDAVSAFVRDGHKLLMPTAHFDAACSVFGIMFFSDHRAGLAELHRVLKSGGRVGITVWQSPSRMEHLAVWERAARTFCPEAACFPRPHAWTQMDSQDGLHREMEGAGFRDISIVPIVHKWEVPSAQWFIENTFSRQMFNDRFGSGVSDQIRETVQLQLRSEYGDRPFSLTAHANIGIGIK